MGRPIGLGRKQQKCKHRQTLRLGLPESQAQKRAGTEGEHSRAGWPRSSLMSSAVTSAAHSCHLTLSGLAVKVPTSPEPFRDCLQIQSPQGHQPGSQPHWQGERKHLPALRGPVGWTVEQKGRFLPMGTVLGLGSSPKGRGPLLFYEDLG